jgi:hypothetical protein
VSLQRLSPIITTTTIAKVWIQSTLTKISVSSLVDVLASRASLPSLAIATYLIKSVVPRSYAIRALKEVLEGPRIHRVSANAFLDTSTDAHAALWHSYDSLLSVFRRLVPVPTALKASNGYKLDIDAFRVSPFSTIRCRICLWEKLRCRRRSRRKAFQL